jgi:hypothetical protein
MEIAVATILILIWLWLNAVATRTVVRDNLSERKQKVAQLILVWLIPYIGSLVVFAVHRPTEPPSRKYYEAANPGDDFGLSGRSLRSSVTPDADGPDNT